MDALKNRDLELAQKVIEDDDQIDRKRYVIFRHNIHTIFYVIYIEGVLRIPRLNVFLILFKYNEINTLNISKTGY
jgi:hypothetical protein